MNSQYMKVNPNELVIDLPVDEAHVFELMESIKRVGLREKPTVWIQDLRIINGFHRVVACQRLGLTEIDCFVDDGDEEAFWDARIIAAKPHSAISDERLAEWIFESWKQSDFYGHFDLGDIRDAYTRFGVKPPMDISADDLTKFAISSVLFNKDYSVFNTPPWSSLVDPIDKWFFEKAQKWGVQLSEIRNILLTVWGHKDARSGLGRTLSEHGLSLAETKAAVKLADVENLKGGYLEALPKWAEQVKRAVVPTKTIKDFVIDEMIRRNKAEQASEVERQKYYQSPAGQAELRKQRLVELDRKIDAVFSSVESLNISEFPESLRRLTSLISAIENKMEESFPEHVKPTKVNPIIVENIELRRQLQEQQRKIESLERALNSKQSATKGLSQAAALSSAEIELMTN